MSWSYVLAENLLFCVAFPALLHAGAFGLARALDDRQMFSIPACHYVAAACGLMLAGGIILQSGLWETIGFAEIWRLDGPWHETRILAVIDAQLTGFAFEPRFGLTGAVGDALLALVAVLTAINGTIAWLGWRSPAALRGLGAHLSFVVYYAVGGIVLFFVAFWVIHWLNFWIFLVALIIIELRRREDRQVRLSF